MDDKDFAPYNSEMADFFLSKKNSVKSECKEHLERLNSKNIYALPIKRKNLKQPRDPSGKFHKTLPGFLINYLEKQGPTKEIDLIRVLSENISSLRNSSGNIYKHSPLKCLQGIGRMSIFILIDDY